MRPLYSQATLTKQLEARLATRLKTHDWSPLYPLTNHGSLSDLPSQFTRGANEGDEWAAEVSSVIYLESKPWERIYGPFLE